MTRDERIRVACERFAEGHPDEKAETVDQGIEAALDAALADVGGLDGLDLLLDGRPAGGSGVSARNRVRDGPPMTRAERIGSRSTSMAAQDEAVIAPLPPLSTSAQRVHDTQLLRTGAPQTHRERLLSAANAMVVARSSRNTAIRDAHAAGMSYRAIGEVLGMSAAGAHKAGRSGSQPIDRKLIDPPGREVRAVNSSGPFDDRDGRIDAGERAYYRHAALRQGESRKALAAALDAALADLGGLDGLESFALRFDAQRSRLASVEADRDRLREALREIAAGKRTRYDGMGANIERLDRRGMRAFAAAALRESEAGR